MPKYAPIQMPHGGRYPHVLHFRVPWRIHEKAWQQYKKLGGHGSQSAERLAQRGGFDLEELIILLAGEDPYASTDDGPMATNFFGEWEGK